MSGGEIGKVYSSGEVICREGEQGDVMYVIQSGKVKITKKTSSGEVEIAVLGSGEIFGEMALFDRLSRSATATSMGEARVLSVDKKKFFSSISRDPTTVFKILESMSQRIRTLDEDLLRLKREKGELLKECLSVEVTGELILEKAKNLVAAENGSVMLLDEDGKKLFIKAAFGKEADVKTQLSVGEGLAGDVLRTGRAVLVNDVSTDSRFVPGEIRVHSLICVPLKCRDHTFGVINLSSTSERLFNVDELKVLDSMATYAALAIEQAESFAKLDSATDEVLSRALDAI